MVANKSERSHYDEVFNNVMALYFTLQGSGSLKVNRVDMKQGEAKAEPLDFTIDVEIKAKRSLYGLPYVELEWLASLRNEDRILPIGVRELLGKTFEDNNLGVDGHYRMLYYRTKNNKE